MFNYTCYICYGGQFDVSICVCGDKNLHINLNNSCPKLFVSYYKLTKEILDDEKNYYSI